MDMDYEGLAKGIENLRESLRAMVAAIVEDGFTDEQAREIVTGVFASNRKD